MKSAGLRRGSTFSAGGANTEAFCDLRSHIVSEDELLVGIGGTASRRHRCGAHARTSRLSENGRHDCLKTDVLNVLVYERKTCRRIQFYIRLLILRTV